MYNENPTGRGKNYLDFRVIVHLWVNERHIPASEMSKWQISLDLLSGNKDLCYEYFNDTFHAFQLANTYVLFHVFVYAAKFADSSTGVIVNIMICSRIANCEKKIVFDKTKWIKEGTCLGITTHG